MNNMKLFSVYPILFNDARQTTKMGMKVWQVCAAQQCFCLLQLAEETCGFVGSDIAGLCREAALVCIRRKLREVDDDN